MIKKKPDTVDNIKQKIIALKGKEVELFINRGRKKIGNYRARIENAYTSVFTVKTCSTENDAIYTYSYNDILCGEVKISND